MHAVIQTSVIHSQIPKSQPIITKLFLKIYEKACWVI